MNRVEKLLDYLFSIILWSFSKIAMLDTSHNAKTILFLFAFPIVCSTIIILSPVLFPAWIYWACSELVTKQEEINRLDKLINESKSYD